MSVFFTVVWGHIRSWLGISSVEPFRVTKHFYQFVYSVGGLRTHRAFLQLIWLCCVWNRRNSRIFKNTESTVHQLVEKVKIRSFWWMKSFNISIRPIFHMWWLSPFVCLGIG